MRYLAVAFLLGSVPLVLVALQHLAGRDYVAGALAIAAAGVIGHLGLELLAIATGAPAPAGEEGGE